MLTEDVLLLSSLAVYPEFIEGYTYSVEILPGNIDKYLIGDPFTIHHSSLPTEALAKAGFTTHHSPFTL